MKIQSAFTRAIRPIMVGATAIATIALPQIAHADESGVSFWLPGLYGSLSAVPQAAPGWSLFTFNYYDRVSAGADVAAAREVQIGRFTPTATVNLSANLNAMVDLQWIQPNYAFATPVLGGQLMLSMGMFVGHEDANITGTLMGTVPPFGLIRSDNISSSVTGFGDLYPVATLRWHNGVDNWMVYGTGAIPVGTYNSMRLANLGNGHGAIDGGGGYTYLNPATGHELSGVGGFTYNFKNPDYGGSERCRFPFRLGRVAVSLETALCRSCRIRLSADLQRHGSNPDPEWIQVAGTRRWSADRVSFSGWKHAGISESKRLRRIRCGKSTIGLECLVDVLDLACGSREHSGPNQAFGDEVSGSASFGNLGDFSSSSIRISRILQRTSDPGCSELQYKTDGSERA